MILIYTIYLTLSALVVFLVFYSSLGKFIKAIALTAAVLLGIITQDHYTSQLGKPILMHPPAEFLYVHHVAEGDNILLWTWEEGKGNRLYSIPYDQETAKKLEEAKKKGKGGEPQEGNFTPRTDSRKSPGLHLDPWEGPLTERTK